MLRRDIVAVLRPSNDHAEYIDSSTVTKETLRHDQRSSCLLPYGTTSSSVYGGEPERPASRERVV